MKIYCNTCRKLMFVRNRSKRFCNAFCCNRFHNQFDKEFKRGKRK